MKAIPWNWHENGIPPSFSKNIGKLVSSDILQYGERHHSGGIFAIARRHTQNMLGPQDQYMKYVVDDEGVVTHDFGSVPSLARDWKSAI